MPPVTAAVSPFGVLLANPTLLAVFVVVCVVFVVGALLFQVASWWLGAWWGWRRHGAGRPPLRAAYWAFRRGWRGFTPGMYGLLAVVMLGTLIVQAGLMFIPKPPVFVPVIALLGFACRLPVSVGVRGRGGMRAFHDVEVCDSEGCVARFPHTLAPA